MTETQSINVKNGQAFPIIEKYNEGQKTLIDKKKATITNMMGSINFSPDRKREKKVARTIRHTIDRLSGTEKIIKKNKKAESRSPRNCSP